MQKKNLGLQFTGVLMEKKYHLRRKDREITDRNELDEILRASKFAVVALVDDGEPYCVTLSCGYDPDVPALYFHAALQGKKNDIILRKNSACATVIDDRGYTYGDCEHKFRSVVLFGTIEQVLSPEEKRAALILMIRHLEKDPEPVIERLVGSKFDPGKVSILKFRITGMTGKKNVQ